MATRFAAASPRFKARIAGSAYLIAVVAALIGEFLTGGKLGMAVAFIAVPCYVAVTLVCYSIFKAVNKRLSLLAASFNFLGLVFEAVRLSPKGVDIALVFHGLYCILIGYVIFRSIFLLRILGLPMTLAGIGWLTFLSPPLASYLSPYNLAFGILGEAALMLGFLAFGIDEQRWNEQFSGARTRQSQPGTLVGVSDSKQEKTP